MGKILVLAEKPSVARDIGRVLNCDINKKSYLEGKKYVITWGLGHLVTLAAPEIYDEKFKKWSMETLPMLPARMKLTVIEKTAKHFKEVKKIMTRKDIDELIIATDAGREGELVARWIVEKVGFKKPIKRLWISSVTDKAIKDGFNKLRPGKDYESLYASAVARAEADWVVGINATRILTCKYNAQLSCGRVQTPALAMIANKENEIENFKPRTFYGINAIANNLKLTWQDSKTKDIRTFDKDKSDKILKAIHNKDAEIIDINKAYKKSYSPKLYDLTELQRDANKIFGYSAKETLSIMQKLYEHHKVLTYPRTDSRYITADIVDTLKDRIKACGVRPYNMIAGKILRKPIKANKSFVDDTKVSDHHAIIPTEETVFLSDFNDRERKIYDLVVKRFLAVLYPPFEYEQTTIKAKIENEFFIAKGKIVINQGWKEIYKNNIDDDENGNDSISEQTLPDLNKGDCLKISTISQTKGQTKPPAHFNEGTLLSAMENPGKYMIDEKKELIKTIGETGGIGTVATRADIIEKLFNSYLMEKKGKDIFITSKGKQLLKLVPEDLKSPTLTAQWEQKLRAIAEGKLNKNTFINEMRNYAKVIVNQIKNSEELFKHDNMTRSKCPECGKSLLEVNGKRGKMLICQDRECGYKKGIAKKTNARCPNCHKKMELRGQGDGQIFVCICGHREKLSAFKKRKEKDKDKGTKKDVARYLKDQNKESNEPINTALADALAKFKF
ncbi:DNA topoisomerase III [Marinisporobacter balticus]|uniref:DNA topoisomerase 3 n=1 Tax=Marinisporobacter balticus TaxID=2018667 RepID=A0A4R2KZQ2_9FIRM|nr:DNA topoisomerase III [Marinisporobacter balticus]TCO79423.1 DNA topoisomerase-3 [Marinisporobacter balticus]